jgi:Tfp pilus assembly protein PilX
MKVATERPSSEKGAALITAIFALLIGTAIGFALYYSAMISNTIAVNDRDNTEATYLADAGINHAEALIKKVPKAQFSSILTNGANTTPNTGDELSVPIGSLWTTADSIPAGNATSGGVTGFGANGQGRYYVSVRNDTATGETSTVDTNGILIITSTGVGRDGATATIEATVSTVTVNNSWPGFLADGDVKNSNTAQILGNNATAQINGQLNNAGNFCAQQKIDLSSSTAPNYNNTQTGSSCTTTGVAGSTVLINQPRVLPPIYDATYLRANFENQSDYVFKTTGVYKVTGGVVSSTPMNNGQLTSAGMGGWSYGSPSKLWTYSSATTLISAVYYFEGTNVKITNGGAGSPVPTMTIIAEGSVNMPNGVPFQPKLTNYSIVSGNDILATGALGVSGNPGLIYAYGQIDFANATTVYGSVIAANFCQTDGTTGLDANDVGGLNLVSRSSMGTIRFSNAVTINTATWPGSGGTNTLTQYAWREIRN